MSFLFSKESVESFVVEDSNVAEDLNPMDVLEEHKLSNEIETENETLIVSVNVATEMLKEIDRQEIVSNKDLSLEELRIETEKSQRLFHNYLGKITDMGVEDYCGLTNTNFISVESVYKDPKSSFALTHEGFVDTVKAIFKRIIAFFANIGTKLKMWFNKWRVNNSKKVDKAIAGLKSSIRKLLKVKDSFSITAVSDAVDNVDTYEILACLSITNSLPTNIDVYSGFSPEKFFKSIEDALLLSKKENLKKSNKDYARLLADKLYIFYGVDKKRDELVIVKQDQDDKDEPIVTQVYQAIQMDKVKSATENLVKGLLSRNIDEESISKSCKAVSKKIINKSSSIFDKIYEVTKTMRELEIEVTKEGDKESLKTLQKNISAAMAVNYRVVKSFLKFSNINLESIHGMRKLIDGVVSNIKPKDN